MCSSARDPSAARAALRTGDPAVNTFGRKAKRLGKGGGDGIFLGLRQNLLQLPDTFHSVHPWQIYVHEHDCRPHIGDVFERVFGIAIVTQALKPLSATDDPRQRAA